MRKKYLLVSTLLALSVLLAACAGQAGPLAETAAPQIESAMPQVETALPQITEVVPTAVEAIETVSVQDLDSLLVALGAAGVTVESVGTVEQPFFTVAGQALRVNGQELQVYVYDTAQAMETDAAQISADGSTIGTNMPAWMDDPHFFKAGPMLVLYLGQDQKIIDILTGFFGPQFAGR